MAPTVESLATLLKRTNIEDHEEVLEAANVTLKQSKGNEEAQHVKIVALLKLDRFDEAIQAYESGSDSLKDRARLEYAYALYKSGKPKEAAEAASHGTGRGLQHVEAQASYRTEQFGRAANIYRELAVRPETDAEADLRINTAAVSAQLEWRNQGHLVQKKKPSREDMEAFELAYNAACASIARGALAQAEVLLKRARDLCDTLEDMTAEEKQAELSPIIVQQAYVLAAQGRSEQADQLLQTVDIPSVPDAATRYIAHMNRLAVSGTENPYLADRHLSLQDLDSVAPDHPFQFQSLTLEHNLYALRLKSLKFGGVASSTAAAIAKLPAPNLDVKSNSISAINAAAHAKNEIGKEAIKRILPILAQRPDDVGLILTVVQLYVLSGNVTAAINLFEGFLTRLERADSPQHTDARYAPGLVAVAVSLYHSAGRKSSIRDELSKAAVHWRRKPKPWSNGVVNLLKAAGSTIVTSQDPKEQSLAKDIFADLHVQNESDKFVSAGLIAADPEAASEASKATLTPIEKLIAGVDVDALENAGVAQISPAGSTAITTRKRPAEGTTTKKPKKIRKSKMPRDYDPDKKPDPERWLPLRDRSTYRPKGKKGKARQALLSQGAAPTVGDSDGSRPATPGMDVVKAKQQAGGAGTKKKKGKGGKR